jgi:hypothetical protein
VLKNNRDNHASYGPGNFSGAERINRQSARLSCAPAGKVTNPSKKTRLTCSRFCRDAL